MVVTAIYSPVSAGTFSRDHYEIVTVGGNKVSKQLVLPQERKDTPDWGKIPFSINVKYLGVFHVHRSHNIVFSGHGVGGVCLFCRTAKLSSPKNRSADRIFDMKPHRRA